VLWLQQPDARAFTIAVDGGAPTRVETAGANGPGGLLLQVPDGPHRVEVRGTDGPGPAPALLGVALERERGVVVDAMGVTGRTVASWLAWDETLVREGLRWRTPDVFVLAYGTNEAGDERMVPERYRATLRAALTRARAAMPDAACVLVGPSDRGREIGGRTVIWGPTRHIAAVQREVAPEFDCMSWDLQAATGGPGSMYRWREVGLASPDLIHFTGNGYRELGRRFVAALDGATGVPVPSPQVYGPEAPHLEDPTP
jgi:lysophospholipase L1-like esterase